LAAHNLPHPGISRENEVGIELVDDLGGHLVKVKDLAAEVTTREQALQLGQRSSQRGSSHSLEHLPAEVLEPVDAADAEELLEDGHENEVECTVQTRQPALSGEMSTTMPSDEGRPDMRVTSRAGWSSSVRAMTV
jgi:hypothetical protein